MLTIYRKELLSFFGSLLGYLVIGFFLFLNGLFLFVLEGPYNIPNSGYADVTPFFTLTPWVLLFLIPAITMRMVSEERKLGTLEILFTKPISVFDLIVGKWLAAITLIIVALIPTLVYVFIVQSHIQASSTFDWGSTLGSYFGVLFLASAYSAIGIFTSSFTSNQLISYIFSIAICFSLFSIFEVVSNYLNSIEQNKLIELDNNMNIFRKFGNLIVMILQKNDHIISYIGMESHYKSISRGVIDTRDLIYFMSVTAIFWLFTHAKITQLKNQ
ncbi:MAG: ABC transporter permease subunit [Flavobacterium sp.]